MNPHISASTRPSTLQWKVGKPVRVWPLVLSLSLAALLILLLSVVAIQRVATRRAVRACDTGHMTCRVSMGYSALRVKSEDAAEDQTVCGDGWRACVDAASEGNIQ